MEKNKLIALVCKLYKASKQAQSLIDVELCDDAAEEQLVTECKKRIYLVTDGIGWGFSEEMSNIYYEIRWL